MTSFDILEENGPMISGSLAQLLADRAHIPLNTASQMVARATDIKKIKGFLKSKQSICYLESHQKTGEVAEVFRNSLYDSGRKYWYTLNALDANGGILSRRYLECYTNYPVLRLKGHIPFSDVIKKFVDQRVLLFNGGDILFSPQFSNLPINAVLHHTIELIKDQVLSDFQSLTKNTGLISFKTGEQFGEFGKFRWGFKGVTAIRGLRTKEKFGYVLGDILLGRQIHKNDVLFFVDKLNHVSSYKNASRLLPVLLVDDLHPEALRYLKQQGVMVGFVKELFGDKYASTLKELIAILTNAGASLKKNPDRYLDLIDELKKYNLGLANNIKGTLFEFMVAHLHRERCQSLDLGKQIISGKVRYDMDVIAIYADKVVVAECKATKSMIDDETIEKWLKNRIPAFMEWIHKQEIYQNKDVEFEYWSTSGFTDAALDKLVYAETHIKQYAVSHIDGVSIKKKVVKQKNKKMKEALDSYFLMTEV